MLKYLGRYGSAEGIDVDAEAIEYCRGRGLTKVTQAGAEKLPFEDASFDLVTALDVIEHTDDDLAVLREIGRVLRPTGALLMTVPAYRFLWGQQDEISTHRRRYVASQVRERLQMSGFAIRRLTYFNSALFPGIALVRLIRLLLPRRSHLESDFRFPAPKPVNSTFAAVFGAERLFLNRFDLPFGVSILALAVKPARG
jgi:SAM-dependent methyltransferase